MSLIKLTFTRRISERTVKYNNFYLITMTATAENVHFQLKRSLVKNKHIKAIEQNLELSEANNTLKN